MDEAVSFSHVMEMLAKACDVCDTLILDSQSDNHFSRLSRLLELTERAAIQLREVAESIRPPLQITLPPAKSPPAKNHSGKIEITDYGWLHIQLDFLLPTCHYQTPVYLTDTLSRLLSGFLESGGRLPYFQRAALVIDEHCEIQNRTVFDQDNKGWKAIPNALKGRVIEDDDQFHLDICLCSTKSPTPCCHIYLMDANDVGDFFALRSGQYVRTPDLADKGLLWHINSIRKTKPRHDNADYIFM